MTEGLPSLPSNRSPRPSEPSSEARRDIDNAADRLVAHDGRCESRHLILTASGPSVSFAAGAVLPQPRRNASRGLIIDGVLRLSGEWRKQGRRHSRLGILFKCLRDLKQDRLAERRALKQDTERQRRRYF